MPTNTVIFCLSLTAITVQCAVLNPQVLLRLARSPCYSCNLSPPPLLLPHSLPSPYFRTQHWSGYGRSNDGSQQGVFSGAAATVGGTQAAGEAFSLASADKSSGSVATSQQDNNRQQQDRDNFKVTQLHYGSESHGVNYGTKGVLNTVDSSAQVPLAAGTLAQSSSNSEASNVKYLDNAQQKVQLNNLHQSHGYASSHIQQDYQPNLPPQGPPEIGKHDSSNFAAQNSGQYQYDSSQVNRGDLGAGETQASGSYSSRGSAGAASTTQEGQVSQVSAVKAGPKPQNPQLVQNYGSKSGAYSGNGYQSFGGNSQSSLGYLGGAGYGHRGYQGYQQQTQQVSDSNGYSHGSNGATANGQGYQDTLKDALNLASQGLETSKQAGCPSCGQGGSYALSNARSHTGNAVALSIGG